MLPVRARLLRVTQKVSSNSIHTLLCSDEHKNSPSGGLRENRFQPHHKAERCVLSLGCKTEVAETTIQEAKTPNVAIPTTPLSFQAEAIQPIFSYRRNQCATIGLDSRRSAGTDRQTAGQSERHTHVGRLRKTVRHWLVATLGYWAKSMAIHGQHTCYCRQEQFQYASGTTPNCAKRTPQAATKHRTASRYGGIE